MQKTAVSLKGRMSVLVSRLKSTDGPKHFTFLSLSNYYVSAMSSWRASGQYKDVVSTRILAQNIYMILNITLNDHLQVVMLKLSHVMRKTVYAICK